MSSIYNFFFISLLHLKLLYIDFFTKYVQGIKVQVTILQEDIELFEDKFEILEYYFVSNAYVRPIVHDFQVFDNNYEWIINHSTVAKHIQNESYDNCSIIFHFTSFNDLHKCINTTEYVGKSLL